MTDDPRTEPLARAMVAGECIRTWDTLTGLSRETYLRLARFALAHLDAAQEDAEDILASQAAEAEGGAIPLEQWLSEMEDDATLETDPHRPELSTSDLEELSALLAELQEVQGRHVYSDVMDRLQGTLMRHAPALIAAAREAKRLIPVLRQLEGAR